MSEERYWILMKELYAGDGAWTLCEPYKPFTNSAEAHFRARELVRDINHLVQTKVVKEIVELSPTKGVLRTWP